MTYAVSSRWSDGVRAAVQRATARAVIYDNGVQAATLYPTGGSVTVDANRGVRRDCTITLADVDGSLTPRTAGAALTPFGNEVKLWRGLVYDDGTTEEVPLGVFVITAVDVADDGSITVTGVDRSARIAWNRWTSAYTLTSQDLSTSLDDLLSDRWPSVETNFDPLNLSIKTTTFEGGDSSDPWASAQSIASQFALDLAFDADGHARLQRLPNLSTATAAATYAATSSSTLVSVGRSLSSEGTYNGVVVVVEGSDTTAPFQAVAWNTDPSSPTYWLGKFGQRPRFFSSPLVTTKDDAQDAADTMLQYALGLSERVAFNIVPDASLDVWDVVSITNTTTGTSGDFMIEALTVPLLATETMSVTAREKTVLT